MITAAISPMIFWFRSRNDLRRNPLSGVGRRLTGTAATSLSQDRLDQLVQAAEPGMVGDAHRQAGRGERRHARQRDAPAPLATLLSARSSPHAPRRALPAGVGTP